VFPPLAGSEWVQGDERRLAALVLHGVTGALTVKGTAYNGAMPAFGPQLEDGELAALLSHVRSRFGGGAAAIAPGTVAQVRAQTASRTGPYDGERELGSFR
jgi:mono/diheme cytochrome c family protein